MPRDQLPFLKEEEEHRELIVQISNAIKQHIMSHYDITEVDPPLRYEDLSHIEIPLCDTRPESKVDPLCDTRPESH